MKPEVIIEYCPKCKWLLRAAYIAQELLTTFEEELKGVSLRPSAVSGRFQIVLNGECMFDRKRYGGFPGIKGHKQLVRDRVCPDKNLGHSDRKMHPEPDQG